MQSDLFFRRLLVSPIVFLYGLLLTAGGMIFPITMVCLVSFALLISNGFIWILRFAGCKLEMEDGFIDITRYTGLNHLLGILMPLWLPFYTVVFFVREGKLVGFED